MLPVLALVGRPNVGKSTLFNRLTRSRDAIVDDQPGVTRDRLYGRGEIDGKRFLAVDTGGLESDAADNPFSDAIRAQVELAIAEAQAILFLLDANDGLLPQDYDIGMRLRQSAAAVYLAVNKSEGRAAELASAEFHALGLGAPRAISAKRGDGVRRLLTEVLAGYSAAVEAEEKVPVFALAGRPNVGKSTLANRLAGESRVLVSATPGTTRDSVSMRLQLAGREAELIDTAGVRRKSRGGEALEKFSVLKALRAIERANVALLMLDARSEVGFQDAVIAGMIRDLGRSMVVLVNKWEGLPAHRRAAIKDEIARKLPHLPRPQILFISALCGGGLDEVAPAAMRAYDSAMASIVTSRLNRTLAEAVAHAPPPMVKRHAVKLKFAHQAGKNPPVIVVHGNLAGKLPTSYRRYLAGYFARAYRLVGTPVRIVFRAAENPYQGRKRHKTAGRRR